MDATTPRLVDSRGRIRLAQLRRHHGPDSPQAIRAAVQVYFEEASLALKMAYAMDATPEDFGEVATRLRRIAENFDRKAVR